jgi:hypothetical protein
MAGAISGILHTLTHSIFTTTLGILVPFPVLLMENFAECTNRAMIHAGHLFSEFSLNPYSMLMPHSNIALW